MGSTLALVSVHTGNSISNVACQALADARASDVLARSKCAAATVATGAFIHVITPVAFLCLNTLKAAVADIDRSSNLGLETGLHIVVEHAFVALVAWRLVHTLPVRRAWMVLALINILALVSSNVTIAASNVLARLAFITAGKLDGGLTVLRRRSALIAFVASGNVHALIVARAFQSDALVDVEALEATQGGFRSRHILAGVTLIASWIAQTTTQITSSNLSHQRRVWWQIGWRGDALVALVGPIHVEAMASIWARVTQSGALVDVLTSEATNVISGAINKLASKALVALTLVRGIEVWW